MIKIKKIVRDIGFLLIALLSQFAYVGCVDDMIVQNYYTFTGETVASYLTNRDSTFSDFISILKKAELFDLLSTYGEYTCFAPNNNAIDSLLLQKNRLTVEDLSKAECDTIAKTHLIEGLYFTTDLEEGAIPATNFLDRYLTFTSSSDTSNDVISVVYLINKTSRMICRDDSVVNGVVHTLDRVITSSNQYLPQLMEQDTAISIFVELLQATGFDKKMEKYIDESYVIGLDSTVLGNSIVQWSDGPRDASYPETRYFGYTAFVEPNYIYRQKGARTAQDVINKLVGTDKDGNSVSQGAFALYDPNKRYTYDHNYTDTNNVVYRFVAYHVLDRTGNYNQWNVSSDIRDDQAVYEYLDPQDFYETMCPFTMMKFQTTNNGALYINRRRVNEGANAVKDAADPYQVAVTGVRVFTPTEVGDLEQSAVNGVYHYINSLLIYDSQTADVLNTRFRIDASTLSPDFLNNPGRNRSKSDGSRYIVTRYKPGFVTNFSFGEQTQMGLRNDPEWSPSYQRDGLDFMGQYDFTVKLPPVPENQYEIRLGINASSDRGIVQVYIDDIPCDIPIDMRIYKSDPKIGSVDDDEDDEDANRRNDKDLRNRGYMKGPDSWLTGNPDGDQWTLRAYYNSMRIILTTETLREGEVHTLRFKSVIDNTKGLFPFDYLELCPKSVFGNPEGEDTH
jgi:uncharacterized surface protein with fasciclin (FAS1) repeats